MASPIPLVPPVTTATRPERSSRFFGRVTVLTELSSLWGQTLTAGPIPRGTPRSVGRATSAPPESLQELSADDEALDLARALPDLVDAHVPVEALEGELRRVAGRPVDLKRVRHDPLGHVGCDQLGLRGLADDRAPLVL